LLQTTPESVGNMSYHGKEWDSGYALEETIFGGRLRHRHLTRHGPFQVLLTGHSMISTGLNWAGLMTARLQMHKVILIIGESSHAEGKERWYTDDYISKQLARLKNGMHFLLWHQTYKRCDWTYVFVLGAGNWRGLNFSTSIKDTLSPDTIPVSFSKIQGKNAMVAAPLSATFDESPHEGESLHFDTDEHVAFVPGLCLTSNV
jgi:hypothetical protein